MTDSISYGRLSIIVFGIGVFMLLEQVLDKQLLHTHGASNIKSFHTGLEVDPFTLFRSETGRWEDNIKMDLREMGGGCGDWMELAQDRDRWRALVSTVMNLRVP